MRLALFRRFFSYKKVPLRLLLSVLLIVNLHVVAPSAMSARPPPAVLLEEIKIPPRMLYGPGPSNMGDTVAHVQSRNLLGHLHPEFLKIMDDSREGMKYVFKTDNAFTFAVSGTGHSGMECALMNLLERGQRLLVVQIGLWGQRAADLGRRLELDVHVIEAPLGTAMPLESIEKALEELRPQVIFVCHGDSSTGVAQPLAGIGAACRKTDTLFLVDTVASLGGAAFDADELGVDCVYSATQKVLNAPPGLAPISFSDRAIERIKNRRTRVGSFYFDTLELGNYWGCDGQPRRYHHTAPISTVYALREALAEVAKHGIDETIQRHHDNAQKLYSQLESAGLLPFVDNKAIRLPCLTTIRVPEGVDWKAVQEELMSQGVEIAGGLGATLGKIWRLGTFGANSHEARINKVVEMLITAVEKRRSNL